MHTRTSDWYCMVAAFSAPLSCVDATSAMTFSSLPSFEPITSPSSDATQGKVTESDLSEPQWILDGELRGSWGEHFSLPEWEDDEDHEGYRAKNGWKVSLSYYLLQNCGILIACLLLSLIASFNVLLGSRLHSRQDCSCPSRGLLCGIW